MAERVGREPDHQRDEQKRISRREDHGRTDPLHAGVPDGVDHLHDRLAQAARRLHDLVGNSAGKVVLEEAEALTQHVAVREPAHAGRHRRGDGLVFDQVVRSGHQRPGNHGDEGHPQQHAAVLASEVGWRLRGLHQVDQVADERHQHHFDHRAGKACHQQYGKRRPERPDEVDIECQQCVRRPNRGFSREGFDMAFKPAEHDNDLVPGTRKGRSAAARFAQRLLPWRPDMELLGRRGYLWIATEQWHGSNTSVSVWAMTPSRAALPRHAKHSPRGQAHA
jgi:hypothetical protein